WASATSTVPMSKGSSSKAPNGPFQTSVLTRASTEQTCSMLRGPMSRIISSPPTPSTATTREGALAANVLATTASTRNMSSRPLAFALRLSCDRARVRPEILLAQRFSHGMSARGQKGIGHAAADDERVDLCEQAAEQVELGRHLGPADDRRERTDRGLQYFRQRL